MRFLIGAFFLGWISFGGCTRPSEGNRRSADASFIGKGTEELALAFLQGYETTEQNMAYSPFGYSVALAIISEGARGVSRDEIATALHFPSDVTTVREAYRSVLERLTGAKFFPNTPEFKNWFYIYENFTVEEEVQNVLRKYYLTDVKRVERPYEYIEKAPIEPTNGKSEKTVLETSTDEPEKVQNEESMKKEFQTKDLGTSPEQAVKALDKSSGATEEGSSATENSKYKGEEDIAKLEDGGSEKKMSMEAGLKSDNLSGVTNSSANVKGSDSKSRIVMFNGLYYKGAWDSRFIKKPANDSPPFYVAHNKKVFVPTLFSQGVFNHGNIPSLDCRAIEIPYMSGRYSLLVLVPNNGLEKLISGLSGHSLKSINDQLTEKLVEVWLPSFDVSFTPRPVYYFKQLGLKKVSTVFDSKTADLSGFSPEDSGLYIDDLLQLVSFKVDAEYSKANFLTVSPASSRSNVPTFLINRPFLFYLRDNQEDIVIVNGKVINFNPAPDF